MANDDFLCLFPGHPHLGLKTLQPQNPAACWVCQCLRCGVCNFSKGLNEVWWAFNDNQLAQPSQRQLFQDNLWGQVRLSHRDDITAAEFRAAVDLFSPAESGGGGLADVIESII